MTLILEQVVVLSVNLADNVMIGAYSETALSGVAAVNQIQFVLQQIVYGISGGLIILASQYWGQHRSEPIRPLTAVALAFEAFFALAMFCVTSLFPEWCVGLFVKDAAVITEGARYLSIVRFSYLFFALTAGLLGAMRSVKTVRLALVASIVSLIVNCSINYVLIFGHFGAPELGAVGAAVGTLVARILEFGIVLFYVLVMDKKLRFGFSELFKMQRELCRDFASTTLPIILQNGLWGIANGIQTAVLGHMATSAMTAYSISTTAYLLLAVAAAGASTAASILVGQQVGKGDIPVLKQTVRTLQLLFLGIGLVFAGILFAIRIPLLSGYNISETTYRLASSFIIVKSIIMFTMSYQMPTNTGIIRGGGDTKFSMILDLISIWLIVLPVSYLAAFVWRLSPVIVVICLNSDQVFKCIPAAIRVNRYHWIRQLTR